MGTTTEKSFTPEELREMRGDTPRQKAEAITRHASVYLPTAFAIALSLLFTVTGTDLGAIAGAFLLVNSSKIFIVLGKLAPKR